VLLGIMDGVNFHIFGMKELDYVMVIMSTFGTLQSVGEEKRGSKWTAMDRR